MKCRSPAVPTFQEVLHLVSHLAGQPVLGQQVEIMHLVFIGHGDVRSPRYELHHLRGVSGTHKPGGEDVKSRLKTEHPT